MKVKSWEAHFWSEKDHLWALIHVCAKSKMNDLNKLSKVDFLIKMFENINAKLIISKNLPNS